MGRTVAIIQARQGSTRLPNKVLADISGMPMVWHVYNRARQIKGIDEVVVAIPYTDHELRDVAKAFDMALFQGSPNDVLDRYYQVATLYKAEAVMRLTADCPLLDPEVSSDVLTAYNSGSWDYVSNCHPPIWPDGLDTEVISYGALERAWNEATCPHDREHVTRYVWKLGSAFTRQMVWPDMDYSAYRWTVDTQEDLDWVRTVYNKLGYSFGWWDVMALPDQRTLTRVVRI